MRVLTVAQAVRTPSCMESDNFLVGRQNRMTDTNDGKADIIFGCIFLVLAVSTLLLTSQIEGPRRSDISIRTFPTFVGVGMTVLSPFLIRRGLKTRGRAAEGSRASSNGTESTEAEELEKTRAKRKFAVRFAMLVMLGFLYTQIIRPVGYLVATPVLVFGAMMIYGDKKWYRLISASIIVTVVLYHLFRTFFRVPLPRFGLW
jgi:putative tricarboxylic transport membrane protein